MIVHEIKPTFHVHDFVHDNQLLLWHYTTLQNIVFLHDA